MISFGRGQKAFEQQGVLPATTATPAPAPTTTTQSYDPTKPWTAPLDGPAPDGYTRVGNQWSYTGTSDEFAQQYPEGAASLGLTTTPAPPPQTAVEPERAEPTDLAGWTAPSGGGGGGGGGVAAAAAPSGGIQGAFQTALMKLLNGPSPQEAGMDVMNGTAVSAYNANAKRQEARDRQLIAERMAAEGFGDSGALESEILGLRARGAEGMNRYAGEQASIAEQGRRDELLNALSMALTFGDNEAARAIQRELGLGQIGAQNYATSTSRDNAMDRLGFDYADLEQRMNEAAMEYLFSGGGAG
jgi:hypothetical protein